MNYINKTTSQYPISEQDIRNLNPNTSFPTPFIPPEEYEYVFPSPQPSYNPITQAALEIDPLLTEKGHYEQQWEVVELYPTQEEADAAIAAHIASLKERKNAEINAARLAANFKTFTHAGKTFACDQLSRSDIDGTNGYVNLFGTLPPVWSGGWKAVDNTYLTITSVDDWKSFYTSMFAAGNEHFVHAQQLKLQLEVATTAEEIQAIVW